MMLPTSPTRQTYSSPQPPGFLTGLEAGAGEGSGCGLREASQEPLRPPLFHALYPLGTPTLPYLLQCTSLRAALRECQDGLIGHLQGGHVLPPKPGCQDREERRTGQQ